jgi:hypothetical protein
LQRRKIATVSPPGCNHQIKALLAANGMENIPVKYLWEVVADSLVVA